MPTTLTPYLSFGGNTREAFAFYEKALGAKIETMMSYAECRIAAARRRRGAAFPPGRHHACVPDAAGGAMLFAGDMPPGMPYEGVKGVMLAIQYDTIDQAHGAFHALSQGGQVTMPLAPAFWAKTFGMLTDRFGVSWPSARRTPCWLDRRWIDRAPRRFRRRGCASESLDACSDGRGRRALGAGLRRVTTRAAGMSRAEDA